MAATGTPTPNLGLRIPVGTDPASVDDINYNSNLLDTVLGAVGNISVKDQLDELSDQIASFDVTQSLTIQTGFSGSLTMKAKTLERRCVVYGTLTCTSTRTKGTIYGLANLLNNNYRPLGLVTQICLAENSDTVYEAMITKNTSNSAFACVPIGETIPANSTLYVYMEWFY